ncbi:transposable element Tcb2 transposase [Trichonephila clavipes]|nr:transposable element Tcb2 transposase [Trichonephila clavipes]
MKQEATDLSGLSFEEEAGQAHSSSTPVDDHDGRICVRHYAGERCLPECITERHSGLTHGVIVWGVISYHGRSNLLRIEAGIFQQDNARPHVAKTVRDLCSTQHTQLLPWHAYLPDMSPIEHVWDLVGRRLSRDTRPDEQ